ncbi:GNAT family N-acetyltransferase [uncultured Arthrobacter sp.]|uniref:GNAT family N-acetyltransferase n=1 Tax=uncultured Arthrobacter sp. TaxID=114050 RepID=UPI0026383093|nr:GNAT family N-acetyltransferase [uncultured Arthrobacter sp.]
MSSRLRLVSVHDAAELAELLRRHRRFLAPWEPLREEGYFTVAGQRADIDAVLMRQERGDAVPLVILDDDGTIAGRLTLNGLVRGPFQSCRMGYWLAEDRTGRGLATQAVQAAVSLAFSELGLHRVQAETLTSNAASRRVLARAGFEQYGLAPRYLQIAGVWQDHVMYQRLND